MQSVTIIQTAPNLEYGSSGPVVVALQKVRMPLVPLTAELAHPEALV